MPLVILALTIEHTPPFKSKEDPLDESDLETDDWSMEEVEDYDVPDAVRDYVDNLDFRVYACTLATRIPTLAYLSIELDFSSDLYGHRKVNPFCFQVFRNEDGSLELREVDKKQIMAMLTKWHRHSTTLF